MGQDHLDYAGPVDGQMILVMVDAHSKWLDVGVGGSCTSRITVRHLREAFARYGVPRTVVTDNGPGFVGEEFKSFFQ